MATMPPKGNGGGKLLRHGNWLLLATMLIIWGFNWTAMKLCLLQASALSYIVHRFLFSFLTVLPAVMWNRSKITKEVKTLKGLFFYSLITISSMAATQIGLQYQSVGIGAVLAFTQPLMVFVLSCIFLKEEPRKIKVLGVLIGFAGVLVVSLRKMSIIEAFSFADLIMILGAFLWAVAMVYWKKSLNQVHPIFTNFLQSTTGFSIFLIASLAIEDFTFPTTPQYLAALVYSSVLAMAIGSIIWLRLLREESAINLSASSLIIPVIALFSGWLIFQETITFYTIIGSSLIFFGIYLVNRT